MRLTMSYFLPLFILTLGWGFSFTNLDKGHIIRFSQSTWTVGHRLRAFFYQSYYLIFTLLKRLQLYQLYLCVQNIIEHLKKQIIWISGIFLCKLHIIHNNIVFMKTWSMPQSATASVYQNILQMFNKVQLFLAWKIFSAFQFTSYNGPVTLLGPVTCVSIYDI